MTCRYCKYKQFLLCKLSFGNSCSGAWVKICTLSKRLKNVHAQCRMSQIVLHSCYRHAEFEHLASVQSHVTTGASVVQKTTSFFKLLRQWVYRVFDFSHWKYVPLKEIYLLLRFNIMPTCFHHVLHELSSLWNMLCTKAAKYWLLTLWAARFSFVQHKWNNKWINYSCTLIFSIHILPCVLHFKAYILCHHNVISKTAEFSCRMLFYSSLVNSDLLLTRAIQHN